MRKFLYLLLLTAVLLPMGANAYGAFTNSESSIVWTSIRWKEKFGPLDLWLGEAEDYLDGTAAAPGLYGDTLRLTVSDALQAHTKGLMWFSDANSAFEYWDGSAIVSITSGTGDNTLDDAYDQGGAGAGRAIDVDSGAVTMTVSDTDNNVGLIVTQNDTTNDPTAMQIVSTADLANAIALDVDGQTTGRDWEGTGASSIITGTGAATFVGLTSAGAAVNLNASSNFATNINTGTTTGALALGGGNGTVAIDSSDWDISTTGQLTSIASVTMDAAASAITLPTDSAADDLLIQITGATDSGIVIQSTGTGADAIVLNTTAGGIDLTNAGTAGEDIDIASSASSVNIDAAESAADAIVLEAAAGGIDILASGAAAGEDIDIVATGSSVNVSASEADAAAVTVAASAGGVDISAAATYDIDITATGGKILANATENAAGAISLIVNGGSSETIVVTNTQGTGASALDLEATAGGMAVDVVDDLVMTCASSAGADDLRLIQTGAFDASISLEAAGTGADAIRLQASAGGLDIDAVDDIIITVASTTTADDLVLAQTGAQDASIALQAAGTGADAISIQASAGGIDIDAVDDLILTVASTTAADDLVIQQTGAQNASVHVLSAGTGEDALTLVASAGGIDITSTNAGAGDIDISANGSSVKVNSTEDAASAILLRTNAGTSETIKIHADQGTGAASIELDSDDGGVTVNAAAAVGAGIMTFNTLVCYGVAGSLADNATPDISGSSYWETGAATTYTGFDTGGGTIAEGTLLIIKSKHAAVFDVTTTDLTGGTADLTTADGDLTVWVYDGDSKWVLISFTDMSDDLS